MVRCAFAVAALAALSLAGCGADPAPTAAAPAIGPRPVATFQELMLSEIDPGADAIWEAGRVITTEAGAQDFLPKTPEQWQALRAAAVRLVEGTNLIAMEGRELVHPEGRLNGEGAPDALATGAALASAAEPPHGRDTFERICSGCHDLALATDTRRSRAEWRDLVERMGVYGLSGTDAERAEVIDYLARTYPPTDA